MSRTKPELRVEWRKRDTDGHAIGRAAHGCEDHDFYAAKNALLRALPSLVLSIPQWNDAPGRTQAEVVAALRKAAELCE